MGNTLKQADIPPQDNALEAWLRDEVVKSYDEHKANPHSGIPAEQMMERVRAAYLARVAKPAR